jgi:Methyltransferase domain
MARESTIPSGPTEAFVAVEPSDPSYPKALADYCAQSFLIQDGQVIQVYEELVNLAYWLRGFAPHNVLEIGTTGSTFFLLSRLASGKKVAVDIRDIRPKIHHFMFGHEWCFFHGDSQTSQMRQDIRSYCDRFDLIFIDGDHRYESVKKDFENYRPLLSKRGVILFHDVDPDHLFKGRAGGEVWRFWAELDEGCKTILCCARSSGRIQCQGQGSHFGGIGIWSRDDSCDARE